MENISWALVDDGVGGRGLRRTDDNGEVWWVPEVPGNRHYEEYLLWLEAGNQPEVIEG